MSYINLFAAAAESFLIALDKLFQRLEDPDYCLRSNVPILQPSDALRQDLQTAKTAFKDNEKGAVALILAKIIDQLIELILQSGELEFLIDLEDFDVSTSRLQLAEYVLQRLMLPVLIETFRDQYQSARISGGGLSKGVWGSLYYGTLGITLLDARIQEWMSEETLPLRLESLFRSALLAWRDEVSGEQSISSHWPLYLSDVIGFAGPALSALMDSMLGVQLWTSHGWESGDEIAFPLPEQIAEHALTLWWERRADLSSKEENYQLKPVSDSSFYQLDRFGITFVPMVTEQGDPLFRIFLNAALGSSELRSLAPGAAAVQKKKIGNWALEFHTSELGVTGTMDAKVTYAGKDPLFALGNEADPTSGIALTINQFEVVAHNAYHLSSLDENELSAAIRLKKATFTLGVPFGVELLKRALPEGIGGTFNAALGVRQQHDRPIEFFWEGGLGLDLYVPVDWETPDVAGISINVPNLKLALKGQQIESGSQLALEFGVSVALNLGPLAISTSGLGGQLALTHASDGQGNVGPLNFAWTLLEPDSLGVKLNAGVASGGGFLARDEEKDRWLGALSLKFSKFTLDGVVMTEGSSVLGIVWANRLNLPFLGGQIEGLGLLVGCDRTVSIDAFAQGLKNNILDSILFPANPVANAPQILATVSQLLPRAEDHTVIGILARWVFGGESRLVTIEVGVLLKFIGRTLRPSAGYLMGQGSVRLRKVPESVFAINVELLGAIDPGSNEYFLKAVLRNSRIGGNELSGAGLIYKGPKSEFVISVGGFNPRYPVPSHPLFDLSRVRATLVNRENLKLFFEGYIALTSSSFQIGILAQLLYKKAGFTVEGLLSLDVLAPFEGQFFVDLALELAVRRGSRVIASIGLEGTLSGTSPWRIEGKARLKLLFLKVSLPINWQSAGERPTAAEPVDALAALEAELTAPENWAGSTPSPGIAIRETARDGVWIDARSTLRLKQSALPLHQEITRLGPSPLAVPTSFEVTDVQLGESSRNWHPVQDKFSPGLYQDVDLDEAVRAPMFEDMIAGLEITGDGVEIGESVEAGFDYEDEFVDDQLDRDFQQAVRRLRAGEVSALSREPVALSATALGPQAISQSLEQPTEDFYQVAADPITVSSARYLVTDSNLQIDGRLGNVAAQGVSYGEARQLLQRESTHRARLNIVHRYEVGAT